MDVLLNPNDGNLPDGVINYNGVSYFTKAAALTYVETLGEGYSIPTSEQWQNFIDMGTVKVTGNVSSGIVPVTKAGYISGGSITPTNDNAYYWALDEDPDNNDFSFALCQTDDNTLTVSSEIIKSKVDEGTLRGNDLAPLKLLIPDNG